MHFFASRSAQRPHSHWSAGRPPKALRAGSRGSRQRALALAFAALLAADLGCNNDDVAAPNGDIASVELVPAHAEMEVGGTMQLQFIGRKADGSAVEALTPK